MLLEAAALLALIGPCRLQQEPVEIAPFDVKLECEIRMEAPPEGKGRVVWPTGLGAYEAQLYLSRPGFAEWQSLAVSSDEGLFRLAGASDDGRLMAVWAEGLVENMPSGGKTAPLSKARGLIWKSDALSVKEARKRPLVLRHVSGESAGVFVLSGRVTFADGSPIPPRSRVYVVGQPNTLCTEHSFIDPETGVFLIPNTGFDHYGIWPAKEPVEEWAFRVETSNGANIAIPQPHDLSAIWQSGFHLEIPEQPYLGGRVAEPDGSPIEGAVVLIEETVGGNEEDPILSWHSGGCWEKVAHSARDGSFRLYLDGVKTPARVRAWKNGYETTVVRGEAANRLKAGGFFELKLVRKPR